MKFEAPKVKKRVRKDHDLPLGYQSLQFFVWVTISNLYVNKNSRSKVLDLGKVASRRLRGTEHRAVMKK
jgi:hypothetical protein